jgi:hypothetical protein
MYRAKNSPIVTNVVTASLAFLRNILHFDKSEI